MMWGGGGGGSKGVEDGVRVGCCAGKEERAGELKAEA